MYFDIKSVDNLIIICYNRLCCFVQHDFLVVFAQNTNLNSRNETFPFPVVIAVATSRFFRSLLLAAVMMRRPI